MSDASQLSDRQAARRLVYAAAFAPSTGEISLKDVGGPTSGPALASATTGAYLGTTGLVSLLLASHPRHLQDLAVNPLHPPIVLHKSFRLHPFTCDQLLQRPRRASFADDRATSSSAHKRRMAPGRRRRCDSSRPRRQRSMQPRADRRPSRASRAARALKARFASSSKRSRSRWSRQPQAPSMMRM
jgi:hypothetical protein